MYLLHRKPTVILAASIAVMIGCSEPPVDNSKKLPAKYIVQQGDSFFSIARDFYGEEHLASWKQIQMANMESLEDPEKIVAGQILLIPELRVIAPSSAADPNVPLPDNAHIVRAGETLSTIARKYYGEDKFWLWDHIYQANKDSIENPSALVAGDIIIIPDPPAEQK